MRDWSKTNSTSQSALSRRRNPVRRIGTSQVVIVAAPSYLAEHGTPTRPQELVHHQCVGLAPPLPWHDAWRIGGEAIAVQPAVVVNLTQYVRAAEIAGLGVAPAPDWLVADALASGELTRVLADFETPSSGIYAVYPTNRLLTASVRLLVEHLVGDLRARGVPS
jgi:DNA-binding transcriptional LysR family regulator